MKLSPNTCYIPKTCAGAHDVALALSTSVKQARLLSSDLSSDLVNPCP